MRHKAASPFIAGCFIVLAMMDGQGAHATEIWQNTNVTLMYTTESEFDPVFGLAITHKFHCLIVFS
jgi:hypothetical protein